MAKRDWTYTDLPFPERLQLVEDIWDSIAREANERPTALPVSAAQRTELRRRAIDADAHPGEGVPWNVVRQQVFKRGE